MVLLPHMKSMLRSYTAKNFSPANSLEHADDLSMFQVAPIVTILPIDASRSLRTPGGRHVSVCPAAVGDDMDCARCGICQNATRKAIIGFPAHGSGKAKAQRVFMLKVA